ncbi:PREDICTED: uncharacterized protein LOC106815918 [Priapulus caudatus]|uniref:Uncharacterized protein LOC106815918 n=1 Tax=Priapulus caudatus TaxID=37621 RepID=A0ABM1EUR8_PRICU|nr:PREDICTED: uncharacterized protein LOC106815918 [Priapulus caudatus]
MYLGMSSVDQLLIMAAAAVLVILFLICMICKLSPDCWLHYNCPLRIKSLEPRTASGLNGNYKSLGNEFEMTQVRPTWWDRSGSVNLSRHSSSEDSIGSAWSGASEQSSASQQPGSPMKHKLDAHVAAEMENTPPLGYTPPEPRSMGHLQLAILYVDNEQKLFIRLNRGRDFAPKLYRSSTVCDPFVRVIVKGKAGFRTSLRPGRQPRQRLVTFEFQTQIHRNTADPVFNETFVMDVSRQVVPQCTVHLLLCDHDSISSPDVVGQASVSLRERDLSSEQEVAVEFSQNTKVYNVVH